MLTKKAGMSVLAVAVLLITGSAMAAIKAAHSSHHAVSTRSVPATPQLLAQKIRTFKPADRKAEARHFDFQNYSFTSLDRAAQRLFPPGTKLSYVDLVLKDQGKAIKAAAPQEQSVRYDYPFTFGRFTCKRTVDVKVDSQTQRVVETHGNGQCG